MIKVIIVDDSPFMRKILRRIIENEDNIVVVGEAKMDRKL